MSRDAIPLSNLEALVPSDEKAVRRFKMKRFHARQEVGRFLLENGFQEMDANCKKRGVWSVTYPLHEAVKQNQAHIVFNLLLFGAKPLARDHWGYIPFDYAKGKQQVIKAFERFGCAPNSPPARSSGLLQSSPPPEGFEEFFAKVGKDPLAIPNSEDLWLQHRGSRKLRRP